MPMSPRQSNATASAASFSSSAATWAIRFYERHGFALVSPQRKAALLKSYWTIPERQIETSVVLANPPDRG